MGTGHTDHTSAGAVPCHARPYQARKQKMYHIIIFFDRAARTIKLASGAPAAASSMHLRSMPKWLDPASVGRTRVETGSAPIGQSMGPLRRGVAATSGRDVSVGFPASSFHHFDINVPTPSPTGRKVSFGLHAEGRTVLGFLSREYWQHASQRILYWWLVD
jgi:hypothetical protein